MVDVVGNQAFQGDRVVPAGPAAQLVIGQPRFAFRILERTLDPEAQGLHPQPHHPFQRLMLTATYQPLPAQPQQFVKK